MTSPPAFTALVLIPGRMNYFYNQSGRRLAHALRALGGRVTVSALADCPTDMPFDLGIGSNLSEVLVGFGDHGPGMVRLRAVRERCRAFVGLAIDCVATPWYRRLHELAAESGADATLDLGLCDQSAHLPADLRSGYRFVFSGLTPAEQEQAAAAADDPTPRPFPWAFVGHVTPERAALVDRLVTAVDPRGFVYLPGLALYPEAGSPHLNQQQYEAVLRRSRRQVWCSHHPHFYLEPERFRASLLTGAVPAKVQEATDVPATAPFREWILTHPELGPRLTAPDDRHRYLRAWQARPTLVDELTRVLSDFGVPVAREGEAPAEPGSAWQRVQATPVAVTGQGAAELPQADGSAGASPSPVAAAPDQPVDGLSVVIAVRCANPSLLRAVRSACGAIAECRRELGVAGEVVVVDGGSGNDAVLRSLLAPHAGNGVRLLPSDGRGVAAARNRGLTDAQFNQVLLFDPHHEAVPENIPTLVRALRESGAAAAYGAVLVRSAEGQPVIGAISNEGVQPRLAEADYLDSFAVLDRDQALAAGGFDPACEGAEVGEFWRRLVVGRTVLFVPVVAGWRTGPAGGDSGRSAGRASLPRTGDWRRYHPAVGAV